ncbi:hypothetical protein NE237_024944 [Protea cynaroides]|uniref:Uncharacterized protein n=1 Tax=Protea cynaroides TaxID=273540 RepID=A0A9Q0H3Y8_9MAGN|nr:hypothetical protein NE237_024944 [Protea cynaroides]
MFCVTDLLSLGCIMSMKIHWARDWGSFFQNHLHADTDAVFNVTFLRASSHALLKVDVFHIFRGDDVFLGLRKGLPIWKIFIPKQVVGSKDMQQFLGTLGEVCNFIGQEIGVAYFRPRCNIQCYIFKSLISYFIEG